MASTKSTDAPRPPAKKPISPSTGKPPRLLLFCSRLPAARKADRGPNRLEKSRSQRILWLLEELRLPYTLRVFKRGPDFLAGPDLQKIHPLGKSPVVSITPKAPAGAGVGGQAGAAAPATCVLAESGAIVEYLCDYFGPQLTPARWTPGQEGKLGGESESWRRHRFFMHYAEGSLMTLLVLALIVASIRAAPVPFFVKPVTRGVAARIEGAFLFKSLATHFAFLEEQLATSPGGGDFFCGTELTGADILMIYPLESARGRAGLTQEKYPRLWAYVDRILARDAYKRAVQRVVDETGEFSMLPPGEK